MSLFDLLFRVATQWQGTLDFRDEFAIAVRMVLAPYPQRTGVSKLHGLEVVSIPKEAERHMWPADVYKEDDRYLVDGVDGVVGCVTARGTTVRECRRRAYRTLNNVVKATEVMYRRDIGDDVENKMATLRDGGWIQ